MTTLMFGTLCGPHNTSDVKNHEIFLRFKNSMNGANYTLVCHRVVVKVNKNPSCRWVSQLHLLK